MEGNRKRPCGALAHLIRARPHAALAFAAQIILFDARSAPARLAAVLIDGDTMEWCELAPPESLTQRAMGGSWRMPS